MSRVLVALVVLLYAVGTPTPASGQRNPPATGAKGVEQELITIEREMADAIQKRDVARLAPMLAEDFTLVTPGGDVMDKAAAVGVVKSGEYVMQSLEFSDMKVRVYGDTAVVTYIGTEKSSFKGQDVSGKSRSIDVFVRRAGKWQQVAGQSTTLPPAK